MSTLLSINKPGLVQRAKEAQRAIVRLQALLSMTSGSHTTATTDAALAKTACDTLIADIAALT